MACIEVRNTPTNQTNTICDLLKKIDQLQRDAIINNKHGNCETCLMSSMYNTKPIAVYTECMRLNASLGTSKHDTANIFRIEDVRGCETVVLRLLNNVNGELICTPYTIVMRIACICCIQCFDPINCELACSPLI